ncbi:MAG: thioredoxin family protein [Planctomycetia bacterium]|nr:thioredoxin family protein [Planctomycetia bacterium]
MPHLRSILVRAVVSWGFAAVIAASASAADLAGRLGLAANEQENPLAAVTAALGDPVTVTAVIEPGDAGKPDALAVTALLEDGWHLYAISQKPGGPIATKIKLAADSPRQASGEFTPDTAPHKRTVDDVPAWKGLVIEEHSGKVTWRAALVPGTGEVRGAVSLQLCQDTTCLPPQSIAFTAQAAGPRAAVATPAGGDLRFVEHAPERVHARVRAAFGRPAVAGSSAWPLVVELVPAEGWHLYTPAGSAESKVGQGKPTIVSAAAGDGAEVAKVAISKVTPTTHAELVESGAVDGPVVLELLIDAPPAAGDAARTVDAIVGFQTCSEQTCDPPTAVRLKITAPTDAPASGAIRFEDARYAEAAKKPLALAAHDAPPAATSTAVIPAMSAAPATAVIPDTAAIPVSGVPLALPLALLMGLAGGLLLNLMPCVLPVLGLKLMSFAQQSGRDRREVFQMNLWYCAGVFAVFFALATASVAANLGLGRANLAWGEQFTSAGFNIAMIGIVFAFALSFLGIWELPIPGFIGEKAGHVQSQEGPAGSFLKGVLSTVLATPCSGPFLGPVFGFTLSQPTAVTYAVFGAIATGMCLPYVLVGLVPGLVKFLPKPGAWMATFKEVLGFVMLGTVVYLFTFLHHEWFVPTLALLIGIWAACWWVGRGQEKTGVVGFGRWVQAATAAAVIGWSAFTLLGPGESVIEWQQPFSRDRIAELRKTGATVMVDFSADWCPTCKFNLAYAIETDKVRAKIEKNRVVPVLADWTDGSPEIKVALEGLQSRSIPVLAIYPAAQPGETPPEPIVLRDLITESQVLEALEKAGPSRAEATAFRSASTSR